jgi:hypothetical protein
VLDWWRSLRFGAHLKRQVRAELYCAMLTEPTMRRFRGFHLDFRCVVCCATEARAIGTTYDCRHKNTHRVIMLPRRIARPLGAFAKEWTCPSCVRQDAL